MSDQSQSVEYLLHLLPNLSNQQLKKDYLNLLKWTETLALVLSLVEDEAQALRVVRLALEVDLMLGARLAGEVKPKFQEKAVNFILEKKTTQVARNSIIRYYSF
ncbi:MAG: hypothetical protein AAFS12_11665 [Cyanobacteria bacterium J06632_19]